MLKSMVDFEGDFGCESVGALFGLVSFTMTPEMYGIFAYVYSLNYPKVNIDHTLDIQTPPEVRYLDPQNIPKTPFTSGGTVFRCLGIH